MTLMRPKEHPFIANHLYFITFTLALKPTLGATSSQNWHNDEWTRTDLGAGKDRVDACGSNTVAWIDTHVYEDE